MKTLQGELAEIIEVSMDNTHDMDVTFADFARAAAEAIVAAMPGTSEDGIAAQLNQLSLAGDYLDLKARISKLHQIWVMGDLTQADFNEAMRGFDL